MEIIYKIILKKIQHYLKEDVSAYSLAIFRIVFGALLFLQSVYWIYIGFIQENIINPSFLFPFIDGIHPLSNNVMNYGVNGVLLISSFG